MFIMLENGSQLKKALMINWWSTRIYKFYDNRKNFK
jgi:hypothetical protein